ncbi:oxysterol-binding protein-related protein 4C-like [Telopea speciosissima]|uniref:oxysterol-binding protein-related protein 4C-like n=1 Tax=Telopea speciosissima TaxID=54955 RepID=UPI001CC55A61|nr:oxysterol-binding protein-related protein 4C-like [Telopea speciosissima]
MRDTDFDRTSLKKMKMAGREGNVGLPADWVQVAREAEEEEARGGGDEDDDDDENDSSCYTYTPTTLIEQHLDELCMIVICQRMLLDRYITALGVPGSFDLTFHECKASTEENVDKNPVLTPPISLDGGMNVDLSTKDHLQRALSVFKNVRPGSDLTRFQLPPHFNLPKSLLQLIGESVYCISDDLLSRCANGKSSLDRIMGVVAWSISTTRPPLAGVAPFNPILGETHHVSRGTLNVLLEQVSHHPPVTALHATDEKEKLEMLWCQHPAPKFHGTTVEATLHGKRQLKLLNHGENYVMNSPKLVIRFFPKHCTDWVGDITIQCEESGLGAELCYRSNPGKERSVKGRIFDFSSTTKSITLYEIKGHWDSTVTAKDVNKGTVTVIYNAKEAISKLKIPVVNNSKELQPSESVLVWSEVSQSILNKEWEKAKEAKIIIENKQRELSRERESRGEAWVPQFFNLSHTEAGGWDCSPKKNLVSSAPIVVPL